MKIKKPEGNKLKMFLNVRSSVSRYVDEDNNNRPENFLNMATAVFWQIKIKRVLCSPFLGVHVALLKLLFYSISHQK